MVCRRGHGAWAIFRLVIVETMERGFPWGLVAIEDETTSDPAPSWSSDDALVTRAASVLVLKVLHESDGVVLVHVARGTGDLVGATAFQGTIDVPSGTLSIGKVGREDRIRIAVRPGPVAMRIVVDSIGSARHVDLVID
jgi:hypothetical protein